MKTKTIALVTICLLFVLVHPINNAFSRTYITYNGEIGKPIISESNRDLAFEIKKHEIHSANKDKIKDDLKTDVSWVRDCMAYGYLEDKGYLGITTVRALMSDISASVADLPSWDQNSINSFFKNKLDWRSKINEGEPPEWQRAELCAQYEKSFVENMKLLANSKPPKDENIPFVAIIAPTEPKEDFLNTRNVASRALHNLYRALGIIYGKPDYFLKAKKIMNEDKVALAAFINNLPYAEYAEYDLDKIAFTAHGANKKGFFSRIGKKDWQYFMASWERFKEKGYKIRVLTVEKSSTLISFENFFKLPSSGNSQKIEKNNEIEIFKSISNADFAFYNFKFVLTPENTILPSNPKLVALLGLKRNAENYRNEIIDEKSENFKIYGQFEIFIPVVKFPLTQHKSGYIIARMPQTLVDNQYSSHSNNPNRYDYVSEKQDLYNRIKEMVTNKKGKVEVVLEFSNHNSKKIDRNVGFRCANGQYIDYVGQLKK